MKNVIVLVLVYFVSIFAEITILRPNGGEVFTRGEQCEITWVDDISEDVKIELFRYGSYLSDIVLSTASDGSFIWDLNEELSRNNYQIKISSTVMPALHNDISDGFFEIISTEIDISITSPIQGEELNRGGVYEITWTDSIPEAVKIDLMENNIYHSTIIDSTDSDGSFNWLIPSDIFGSNFKLAVTSTLIDTLIGISEGDFTIKKGSILITAPSGGDLIEKHKLIPIEWTDDIPEDILVSIYKNTDSIAVFQTKSSGKCKWGSYFNDLDSGADYKIKLESIEYDDVYYETGLFSLVGTYVDGSISGVFSLPNSPYILTDSSFVESSNSLTVEPGVKIAGAKADIVFDIKGTIEAIGELDNNVIFENVNLDFNSSDPDTSKIIYSVVDKINSIDVFEKNPTTGRGYSLKQTSDNGFIITGEKDGDVLLTKTDIDGNESWSTVFGGINADRGYSVEETFDNGYIIVGITESYGAGGVDAYLIKVDINGNEEWNKTFGGAGYDVGISLKITADDGYIVAGSTNSYGAGGYDVWLIKTDMNGNEEWNKTFGSTNSDFGRSIEITSDSGYVITGSTNGSALLLKTDFAGNEEWFKTFVGTGVSVKQTTDNGYIIGGTKADQYPLLIKTDLNGDEEWNRTYETSNYYIGSSVSETRDGGFIFGSHHYQGMATSLLTKVDYNGNEEWSKHFDYTGSENFELLLDVIQSNDGGYVFTGYAIPNVLLIKTDQYGNVKYENLNVAINNNSNVILQNNIIHNLDNYGLIINDSSPIVTNNLISNNNGGIKFVNSFTNYVVNNTIADNDSIGLYFEGNSDGQYVNNIIYGNDDYNIYINADNSDPDFIYNNIENGSEGFGLNTGVTFSGAYADNIDSDPLFEDLSYSLSGGSPCLNAGYQGLTNELLDALFIPSFDLLGNSRLYGEIDMGAYERQTVNIEEEFNVEKFTLCQNYPNPFNPNTTIRYLLQENALVQITVFDITGREVCDLINEKQSNGYHEASFNGKMLSSGIYFYNLKINNKIVSTKKMMLMK